MTMASDLASSSSASQAPLACASCKYQKRKCDRLIPACSMCKKRKVTCEYRNPRLSRLLRQRSKATTKQDDLHLRNPDYRSLPPGNFGFPAAFFLDSTVFQRGELDIRLVGLPVPQVVHDLIGDLADIQSVAAKYFENIHPYMCIISKQRFYTHLLNPLSQPRAESALLLLCLRLVTLYPPHSIDGPPAKALLYLEAKRFYAEVEASGVCAVQVLQAGILIALYELGHAIYPQAYLSIGICARYGVAFNFDGKAKKLEVNNTLLDWVEIEENKRAWWAVLILDRFVNLGTPTRGLATADPETSSVLPIDDKAWDSCTASSAPIFTLISPSSMSMGRFARLAQATYLLGRVLRHISDYTVDQTFHKEEAQQLRRTLRALVSLSEIEGQVRQLEFCTQTAICWSALLILRDSTDKETSAVEEVARETLRIARDFLLGLTMPVEKVSPFILHLMYSVSAICIEDSRDMEGRRASEDLGTLKKALGVLDTRWKAAGAYLEILKAREIIYF